MPLPESSDQFLGLALDHIADNGVIHYYRFLEEDNWIELEDEIEDDAASRGLDYDILDRVECGERGPTSTRVCIDFQVTKHI